MAAAVLALLLGLQAAAAAAVAEPAPAPDPLGTWRKVIVTAIRNCPQSHDGEIVVCARDVGEAPPAYRYPRLTGRYEGSADDAHALPARPGGAAGAGGIGSCSAVGAGGATGCGVQAADTWHEGVRRDRAAAGWP